MDSLKQITIDKNGQEIEADLEEPADLSNELIEIPNQVINNIRTWKDKLIDLTKRNPLLYFKETKTSTLKITNPTASKIFDLLVNKDKKLYFPQLSDDFVQLDLIEEEIKSSKENAAKYRALKPNECSTNVEDDRLNNILYNLKLKSKSSLEEMGVNTLYLAVEFLHWYESQDSKAEIISPLFLIPVSIKREAPSKPYFIELFEEDVIINPVLAKKLKNDFNVDLPEFDEQSDFDQTLEKLTGLLILESRWFVAKESYLGIFQFLKLIMYKDLEINHEIAIGHPIISALAGDLSKFSNQDFSPIPDENDLDEKILLSSCFQVLDADPSQQKAIVAAKEGYSFVLQGPPGTGKSQSIANMIAECLSDNKKVLFVSQKMAALEVVFNRLKKAGFSDFCLELHSHKANKRDVIAEIGRTLEQPKVNCNDDQADTRLQMLKELRDKLNAYAKTLSNKRSKMQITPFQAYGRLAKLSDFADIKFDFDIADLNSQAFANIESTLKQIIGYKDELRHLNDHPWKNIKAQNYTFELHEKLEQTLKDIKVCLKKINDEAHEFGKFIGLELPKKPSVLRKVIELFYEARPAIFNIDIDAYEARYANDYKSIFRLVNANYRKDAKELKQLIIQGKIKGYKQALALLNALLPLKDEVKVVNDKSSNNVIDINQLNQIDDLLAKLNKLFAELNSYFLENIKTSNSNELEDSNYQQIKQQINLLIENLPGLKRWIDFTELLREATENGLTDFIESFGDSSFPVNDLMQLFSKGFYKKWIDRFVTEKELANFSSELRQAEIEQFVDLDRESLDIAKARLAQKLSHLRPDLSFSNIKNVSSETNILRREIGKKRRHKPLRKLFKEIPNLLLSLKPCLLMSPLSVSQYLDPNIYKFDVVIFDEASQVLPEDAICSIMRGKQCIVAGDSKQLPPTSFFQILQDGDNNDDYDDDFTESDSILELMSTIVPLPFSLKWHYRSKAESLIAFSNHNFYDNQLFTFPNASDDDKAVSFIFVEDGVYDRGRSRVNKKEAKKVSEEVFNHFKNNPERSLGVVAFSQSQQRAILQWVDYYRTKYPDFEQYFNEGREEPFFVKNLESVQGDERDSIFISVGYAKDAAGRMSMNFGPINGEYGWRRLNVLVSRAKYEIKVFSSITDANIDISRAQKQGVKMLHHYLKYVKEGKQALINVSEEMLVDTDSPFEDSVYDALKTKGYDIHKQVGCSGYKIDLAIVHPDQPGDYILGIECDGATYHSCLNARARDRLRQQVLEDLGWKIHRIWSRDWVFNKQQEIEKITEKVTRLLQNKDKKNFIKPAESNQYIKTVKQEKNGIPSGFEYLTNYELVERGGNFYERSDSEIASILSSLIDGAGPMTVQAASRKIANAFGLMRAGSEIRRKVSYAAKIAAKQDKLKLGKDGFWPITHDDMTIVRIPFNGQQQRPIADICIEELASACLICVKNSVGITRDELITMTARIMKISRTGKNVQKRLRETIDYLLNSNRIINDGEKYKIP